MKKLKLCKILAVLIVAVVVTASLPISTEAYRNKNADKKDWTGYTPISSMWELNAIRNDPYGKYYLVDDILLYYSDGVAGYNKDYSGWDPIGKGYVALSPAVTDSMGFGTAVEKYGNIFAYNSTDDTYYEVDTYDASIKDYYRFDAFYGVLDGNGYKIINLKMDSMNTINGLVGVNYGTLHNIRLESTNISGYIQAGTICSVNYGIITDCFVSSGAEVYGGGYVGGICGSNYGVIMGCYYNGWITGGAYCGGIVGLNCGYVQKCFNYAQVEAVDYAGGIAGIAYHSTITECVSKGYVKAENGTHGAVVGLEDDDGAACNTYRNNIYVSYIGSHTGEKGTASIIQNQTAFTNSGYYFDKPYYYADKCFDVDNELYFGYGGTPYPQIHPDFNGSGTSSAMWNGVPSEGFKSGNGTKKDPYIIENASQLAYLSKRVAGGETFEGQYIELCDDIYLNNTSNEYWQKHAIEFLPIGNIDTPFAGHFDGKGHTVQGVYCNRADSLGTGLFGCVTKGSLSNVNAEVYIKGVIFTGGLCGANGGAEISNCSVSGYVRGVVYAGMVCGSNYGDITRCSASGTLYASALVGGISGDNLGTISESFSGAAVSGADEGQGGICGENYGDVRDCYTTGEVNGKMYVGGICGINNDGTIATSYSKANISGWLYVGAVSGSNKVTGAVPDAGIKDCYYLEGSAVNFSNVAQHGVGTYMSGSSANDVAGEATGCSDASLKEESTFEGFDFNKIWTIGENESYPYPEHKAPAPGIMGDVNGDGEVNSIDTNLLKRHLTDNTVEIDTHNADVSGDGELNAMDSNLLKRIIAGAA